MNRAYIKICFALSGLILLLSHCADRQRLNPLDPQNPDTHGKITGMKIYSEFNRITLTWHGVNVTGLKGYHIYRKTATQDSFVHIQSVTPSKRTFTDYNVTYFKPYCYRVSAFSANFESQLSDSVQIIPGPSVVWVTDAYNYSIIQYSYDCTHEITRISADGYPWAIQWNHYQQDLWYSDLLLGRVYRRKKNLLEYFAAPQYWQPVSMDIDPSRNAVWVANDRASVIRIMAGRDDPITEIERPDFQEPSAVAIDERRHYCWVADPASSLIFRGITTDTTLRKMSADVINPLDISIDINNGSCWVADSSRIVQLNISGEIMSTIQNDIHHVFRIAVDGEMGHIWAAMKETDGHNSRIRCYDMAGQMKFEISGFNEPHQLLVDPETHDCLVTDSGNRRVVRISIAGDILFSNDHGLYFPVGIEVDTRSF